MNTDNPKLPGLLSDSDPESGESGKDFYLENGFIVFTASYHLKRGYCCRSGCRHCPYHTQ
ncbi:MAG: hypothetical protein IPJ83_12380 [Saprospiraceae bacterium]|nr:hypothetical protein [Candidatus Vicinibacter proximus]HRG31841.1 DUF5522 domain-containing protein [Saprospiraceae bacterium]